MRTYVRHELKHQRCCCRAGDCPRGDQARRSSVAPGRRTRSNRPRTGDRWRPFPGAGEVGAAEPITGCRHREDWHVPVTPHGYIRGTYSEDEVDLFAVYCGDLDRCFLVPAQLLANKTWVSLRLTPPRNRQRSCVNLADDFTFDGAVAQLARARAGSREARGSSPLSSTRTRGWSGVNRRRLLPRFSWILAGSSRRRRGRRGNATRQADGKTDRGHRASQSPSPEGRHRSLTQRRHRFFVLRRARRSRMTVRAHTADRGQARAARLPEPAPPIAGKARAA